MLGIIGEHKGILITSGARIQKWLLFLSNYQGKLAYRPGNSNSNTYALSCLPPPPNDKEEQDISFHGINLLQLDNSPVSSKEVERKSRGDDIIAYLFIFFI